MTKAERTKQHIIETAAPIFNKKGVAGTTIDDVLLATKLAKGCLYSHFENKEVLAMESVDYLLYKVRANSQAALDKESTAKAKLFVYLDLRMDTQNRLFEGGCPILNFGMEADDTNMHIKQKVKKVIQSAFKTIRDIVEMGIRNKEFSKDFNGEEFAVKVFTLMEGNILVGRVLDTNKYMKMMNEMLKKEIEEYSL
jgi:AcrR family transcriptional regulator